MSVFSIEFGINQRTIVSLKSESRVLILERRMHALQENFEFLQELKTAFPHSK